jgi:para-nitrobenzyl esterase
VADSLRGSEVGAAHATEIPFVFDTADARYGGKLTEQDKQIAAQTHAYWVAFAKTGTPAPEGLPAWPLYDPSTDGIVDFRVEGPVVGPDPAKARLDVVEMTANP